MSGDVHVRFCESPGVRFPRATRLVICCRGSADKAMLAMRSMMQQLKLTVNETKTRQCRVPDETFDFLGYTLGRCWSPKTGRAYIGTRPSKTKVTGLCRVISDKTGRRWGLRDANELVDELNRTLLLVTTYCGFARARFYTEERFSPSEYVRTGKDTRLR